MATTVNTETEGTLRNISSGNVGFLENMLMARLELEDASGLDPKSFSLCKIAALIAQSYEAGAFVGEITLPRLELVLANWNDLPFGLRVSAGKQIRYAWIHEEDGVVEIARQRGAAHVIRLALRTLPGAVERFDAGLARSSE